LIAYLCEIDNLSVKTNIFLTKAFTGWSFNVHLFIVNIIFGFWTSYQVPLRWQLSDWSIFSWHKLLHISRYKLIWASFHHWFRLLLFDVSIIISC
jgi:hypothetical protein